VRRKRWALAGAAALAAVATTGGAVVASGSNDGTPAAQEPPANTVKVERGKLSAMVSLDGILTYRARADGSPYAAINQAAGTYTKLPDAGEKVDCGDVFYRVDDDPVLLLCGTVPAYRDLHTGDKGKDVRQLNRNLHKLGYDADDNEFTGRTEKALEELQHDTGSDVTGALAIGGAVFLPGPMRVAKVTGELGGSARPGAPVAQVASDRLEVQVNLEPSQPGAVKVGDRARITLPGNASVTGRVDRLGRVAQTAGKDAAAGTAAIPAYISLDKPEKARGLDLGPGPGRDHDHGSAERPERPGHRARRKVRRRVRGRGRA
jgi:hypothetical protein